MSNEISVTDTLSVVKRDPASGVNMVNYNRAVPFRGDLTANFGPCVDTVLIPTTGLDIDLSTSGVGGRFRATNQDPANYVQWGLRDTVSNKFYVDQELLPGEPMSGRISRFLGGELGGTAAGTSVTGTTKLHLKAVGGPCYVMLEVFPK